MKKLNYYDGHHKESDKTLEEIEKELKQLIEEDKNLTEWPEIN